MSILSAIRQQSGSIDDLAKLPQAMIMQMAQKKQISTEMVAPILARKAEMIDAAAKSKAMQGGLPQTSVMEQIIAQNSAAEQPQQMPQQMPTMENAGVAQLPVPERMYAGGGIVAFARGSLIDDDEEIDPSDDYAKAAAMVQRANAMPVGMPATMPVNAPAVKSILPQSYEAALAEKGQTPASVRKMMIDSPKKGDYVMPPMDVPKRGGHKYEDMVIKEAQRLGVDPSLALHVLYKETGNLKNPETAKSSAGALGVMQLMPKTAKGLGVDPLNPEENIRGGVTYLKQMYDRYQDPTLALAAYNAGPGRLDKALKSGQGISGLPRETQNYIVANRMAGGGEVKHFIKGDLVMGDYGEARRARVPGGVTAGANVIDDFGNLIEEDGKKPQKINLNPKKPTPKPTPSKLARLGPVGGIGALGYGLYELAQADLGTPSEFLDPIAAMQGTSGGGDSSYDFFKRRPNLFPLSERFDYNKEFNPSKKEDNKSSSYVPPIYTGMDSEDASTGLAMRKPPDAAAAAAAAVPTPVKEKTAMDLFLEQNAADREALGKQRAEDRNMALLAAGLGMLGGESPYAFSNIGKGGLSGVSYLSDANKQRAAQQAALDKNRVAAMHYGNVGKYYESQTLSKEEKAELQRQKLADARITAAKDDYRQFEEMLGKRFKDQYPMASMNLDDPKNRKIYNDFMAQYEPILENLRKTSGYTTLPPMGNTSSLAQQAAAEKAKREANK